MTDSHTSFGKSVGGQYIDGLTIVAREVNGIPRPAEEQNHAKLHEMAHGLEAPNALVVISNDVMVMGRGLVNQRKARAEAIWTLNDAKEAVVDTLTTSVSDLDTAAYLQGDMPDVGYWEFNNGLRQFTVQNPAESRALWEGTFYRGARDRAEAIHIAATYEPYLPPEANQ